MKQKKKQQQPRRKEEEGENDIYIPWRESELSLFYNASHALYLFLRSLACRFYQVNERERERKGIINRTTVSDLALAHSFNLSWIRGIRCPILEWLRKESSVREVCFLVENEEEEKYTRQTHSNLRASYTRWRETSHLLIKRVKKSSPWLAFSSKFSFLFSRLDQSHPFDNNTPTIYVLFPSPSPTLFMSPCKTPLSRLIHSFPVHWTDRRRSVFVDLHSERARWPGSNESSLSREGD